MKILVSLLAVAATTFTVPAAAAPGEAVSEAEVSVSVNGLDLTILADRDRLDRRIDRAVRKVCATGLRGLDARQHELDCREAALAAIEEEKRIAIANAHRERLRLARAASRTTPTAY